MTFEEKYEKMKDYVIKDVGKDIFDLIKEKIYYSKESESFYLIKNSGDCGYQFYDAKFDYFTTGFNVIVQPYIDKQ